MRDRRARAITLRESAEEPQADVQQIERKAQQID